MKIISIVNKISKTSVPFQWNLLFCARKDGNSYFIYGFGIKALVSIFRSDLIHTHHIKSGFIFNACAFISGSLIDEKNCTSYFKDLISVSEKYDDEEEKFFLKQIFLEKIDKKRLN
jgi:hypothetical protein